MKTKYISALALLAGIGFASCSSDETALQSSWAGDPNAVRFTATIGNGKDSRSNPIGNEVQQSVFNPKDRISVQAGEQPTAIYSFNGSEWTPEAEYPIWGGNVQSMDFKVFYPVIGNASLTSYTLPTDQSDLTKIIDADYMTYTGTLQKDRFVQFNMQRKTARIIVKIEKLKSEFETPPVISAVSIKGNGTVYSDGTGSTPAVFSTCAQPSPETIGSTYTALVAPMSAVQAESGAQETFITLMVNDKELVVRGLKAAEAGMSYTYALTVGKDLVEVNGVTASLWEEVQGGSLDPYRPDEGNIKQGPSVSPTEHLITMKKAGTLSMDHINRALGLNGDHVKIQGPINDADISNIRSFLQSEPNTNMGIDLSAATEIVEIPKKAFFECPNLLNISLPETPLSIGARALSHTGIKELVIGSSVQQLGDSIVEGCTLDRITLKMPKKNVSNIALKGILNVPTITVHESWEVDVINKSDNQYTLLGGTFTNVTYIDDYGSTVQPVYTSQSAVFENTAIRVNMEPQLFSNGITYEVLVNASRSEDLNTFIGQEEGFMLRTNGNFIPEISVGSNMGSNGEVANSQNITLSNRMNLDKWYHLAATLQPLPAGGLKAALYVNGKLEIEKELPGFNMPEIGGTGQFRPNGRNYDCKKGIFIGKLTGYKWGERPFNGMMKEIRVWNKVRTAEEIAGNMLSVDPKTEGLHTYYKLDGKDIKDDRITDATGNGHYGMINGTLKFKKHENITFE